MRSVCPASPRGVRSIVFQMPTPTKGQKAECEPPLTLSFRLPRLYGIWGNEDQTSLGSGLSFARSRAPLWFQACLTLPALAVLLRVVLLPINWPRFQPAGRSLVV